jgi:hypothetical protein
MDYKKEIIETLNKIQALFAKEKEVEYQKARTMDGTMVAWSDETLTAGSKFYVMSGEGVVAADSGQYELENGDIVVVESGAVTDLLMKQHEEMNQFNEVEFKEELNKQLDERLTAIEAKFAESLETYTAKLEALEVKLSENKNAQVEEVISAVNSLKAELSKVPTEEPTRKPSVEFAEQGKYAAIFNQLKK